MEQGHIVLDTIKAMKDDEKINRRLRYKMNPDLEMERKRCSFDPEEFAIWYFGSKERLQETRAYQKYFLDQLDLDSETPEYYKSHADMYNDGIKKLTRVFKKRLEDTGSIGENMGDFVEMFGGRLDNALAPQGNPLQLHFSMFLNTFFGQADDEQLAEFAPRIMSGEIIGTYAQTELGHGTYLQGLETTATYDEKTQEFVLHTPTLSAYKWWPGALGHTANYAVVVAQLYIKGECHNVHAFIVQLRDESTHMPLNGIEIGEVGAKMGLNLVNNGFLCFNNFRIKRKQMLMKNAKVLEDGTYIKPKSRVLNYGSMIFMRAAILEQTVIILSKCVVIAIRFSCVRRQGKINPDAEEVKIIDYLSQQHKLFSSLAKVIVFKLISTYFFQIYTEVTDQVSTGNIENLPDLHATTCCLKAVMTKEATEAAETCRSACGGHGYMMSSRLPQQYAVLSASCTYEGENTVLLLQTARYLIKAWNGFVSNTRQLGTTLKFIERGLLRGKTLVHWEQSPDGFQKGLEAVAFASLQTAVNKINNFKSQGCSSEESNNLAAIDLINAANDYCHYYLVSQAFTLFQSKHAETLSKELKETLMNLITIYAIECCLKSIGGLLVTTDIGSEGKQKLVDTLGELLGKVRPNAAGLVDGFSFDRALNSTLGASDGDIYERLYDEALKSPLNQQPVPKCFEKSLKSYMTSKL